MWNLLSNAIKFTPAGGRVERATVRRATRTVDDRGRATPGAASRPTSCRYVFDRFRQADGVERRARTAGSGSAWRSCATSSSCTAARVHVESAGEGRGATFTVRLPVARAAASRRPLAATPARGARARCAASDATVDLTGIARALVDDEADARELLAAVLRAVRRRASWRADVGRRSAAPIARERPHVLLSDIGCPARTATADPPGARAAAGARRSAAGGGAHRVRAPDDAAGARRRVRPARAEADPAGDAGAHAVSSWSAPSRRSRRSTARGRSARRRLNGFTPALHAAKPRFTCGGHPLGRWLTLRARRP